MFEARDPDFENAVRNSFASQSFMKLLGAELETVRPGQVIIAYERNEALLQQHGFLHAGVGTSVVDSACGYAAWSLAPAGTEVLTSEFKVHFLRPSKGRRFRAIGTVLKPGKLLTICEGEVFQDDDPQPVLKMSATLVIR